MVGQLDLCRFPDLILLTIFERLPLLDLFHVSAQNVRFHMLATKVFRCKRRLTLYHTADGRLHASELDKLRFFEVVPSSGCSRIAESGALSLKPNQIIHRRLFRILVEKMPQIEELALVGESRIVASEVLELIRAWAPRLTSLKVLVTFFDYTKLVDALVGTGEGQKPGLCLPRLRSLSMFSSRKAERNGQRQLLLARLGPLIVHRLEEFYLAYSFYPFNRQEGYDLAKLIHSIQMAGGTEDGTTLRRFGIYCCGSMRKFEKCFKKVLALPAPPGHGIGPPSPRPVYHIPLTRLSMSDPDETRLKKITRQYPCLEHLRLHLYGTVLPFERLISSLAPLSDSLRELMISTHGYGLDRLFDSVLQIGPNRGIDSFKVELRAKLLSMFTTYLNLPIFGRVATVRFVSNFERHSERHIAVDKLDQWSEGATEITEQCPYRPVLATIFPKARFYFDD